MPPSTSRYTLLQTRLDRLVRLVPGVESGEVRAVHQARVASRRLRELLPVLQLDPAQTRKLGRRLRKATRGLGAARELDVLQLLIDELQESGRHPPRALQQVREGIRTTRGEMSKRHRTLAADLARILRKLGAAATELEGADRGRSRGWRWALDARVARRAVALRKVVEEAGAVDLPERLHVVRIALKKLRYGVELAAEAAGDRTNMDVRSLKRSQELLGRMHDLQVLIDRVRGIQASLAPTDVTAWRDLDALVLSLERSCRRLHARYVRQRAAIVAICDRLGGRSAAAAGTRRAG
jgi:CHAD domain-containing protein